jgi:hypothetical protein
MKKLIPFLFLLLTLAGCKKECEFYLEGKKCDTEIRTRYFGTYVGVATINGTNQNATAKVTSSSVGAKYFIIDDQIDCVLTEKDKFYIPQQVYYTATNTVNVEGSGSFSGNQLIYNAALSSGGGPALVLNFTGTK